MFAKKKQKKQLLVPDNMNAQKVLSLYYIHWHHSTIFGLFFKTDLQSTMGG